MATETQQLRDSLIRSLQAEPLLVETEMSLHSLDESDLTGEFRQAVATSLKTAPPLAEVHREDYGNLDRELINHFRSAMQAAVQSGANLSEAEKDLLSSLDLEKLGEFRSTLDTHLESEPEIAKEDLAIYVPAGLGISETFRRSLESQPGVVEEIEEQERHETATEPSVTDRPREPYAPGAFAPPTVPTDEIVDAEIRNYAPGAYVELVQAEIPHQPEGAPVTMAEDLDIPAEVAVSEDAEPVLRSDRADAAIVAASLRAGLDSNEAVEALDDDAMPAIQAPAVHGMAAVPTLTAALQAIGSAGDDFGFLVRYGRYAPEGRRSEFLVGGLGISDLSKRLTSWLETHGSLDDQVQVIDEGSGELTIYLVAAETQY